MSLDTELEDWKRDWQAKAEVPADLRRKVERQSRRLKISLAGDVLVTVAIGGGTLALAVRSPQPDMVLLAVVTWTFIAAAWAFRLLTTRGLWSHRAVNTAAFVDLSARRCRAQMKASAFGGVLFVCEMVFCLGWIYRHEETRVPIWEWLFSSWFHGMVWGGAALFYGFLVWYRRKKRAELAWLRDLREPQAARRD